MVCRPSFAVPPEGEDRVKPRATKPGYLPALKNTGRLDCRDDEDDDDDVGNEEDEEEERIPSLRAHSLAGVGPAASPWGAWVRPRAAGSERPRDARKNIRQRGRCVVRPRWPGRLLARREAVRGVHPPPELAGSKWSRKRGRAGEEAKEGAWWEPLL